MAEQLALEEPPVTTSVNSTPPVETDVSTHAETIRNCVQQLIVISQREDLAESTNASSLVTTAAAAYGEAREQGGKAYTEARIAYNDVWAASLQANFALATQCVDAMSDIDMSKVGMREKINNEAIAFNRLLERSIDAISKLWAGKHVITYNYEDLKRRVATYVQQVKAIAPHHRFPQSVDVESLLRNNL